MAESTSVVEDNVKTTGQGSVVAAPKFVFGQNMSERIIKGESTANSDSDNSPKDNESKSNSEAEEENRNSVNKKRPAGNCDSEKDDLPDPDGPLSPIKKVAKVFQGSLEVGDEPRQFKLKPSILNEVAKNLTGSTGKGGNSSLASSLPKTFGLSTCESSSAEDRQGATAPEPLTGQNKNYFQMFLDKNEQSTENQKAGSFVFGRNMSDRVSFATPVEGKENNGDLEKPDSDSEDQETTTKPLVGEPKTLADLAKSCENEVGPKTLNGSPDKQQLTLAEAANVYQKNTKPCQSKLEQVEVITGEEEERNVMHINCRLFLFDAENHSWKEKGRGSLRLNDMCQSSPETTFQSRLVMRTQGHLRVMLNTKLWPEMTLDRANERSLRITGLEAENDVKIYLIMAGPKDIQQLYTAIDRRIQALRREKETQTTDNPVSSADGADTKPENEAAKKKETGEEGDASSKDKSGGASPDGSSNDSFLHPGPREPNRRRDSGSDDE